MNTVVIHEEIAGHLLSKHNISFLLNLMRGLQSSVFDGTTELYVKNFLEGWFSKEQKVPDWIN